MQDCNPRCKILPSPLTKVHSIKYVTFGSRELLAVATEDGRVVLYSTHPSHLLKPQASGDETVKSTLSAALHVSQIDNKSANKPGRVKAFEILRLPKSRTWSDSSIGITCSSDGSVNLWHLKDRDVVIPKPSKTKAETPNHAPTTIGDYIGTYQTNGRITCLVSYVMLRQPEHDDAVDEADSLGEDESDTTEDSDDEEQSGDDDDEN